MGRSEDYKVHSSGNGSSSNGGGGGGLRGSSGGSGNKSASKTGGGGGGVNIRDRISKDKATTGSSGAKAQVSANGINRAATTRTHPKSAIPGKTNLQVQFKSTHPLKGGGLRGGGSGSALNAASEATASGDNTATEQSKTSGSEFSGSFGTPSDTQKNKYTKEAAEELAGGESEASGKNAYTIESKTDLDANAYQAQKDREWTTAANTFLRTGVIEKWMDLPTNIDWNAARSKLISQFWDKGIQKTFAFKDGKLGYAGEDGQTAIWYKPNDESNAKDVKAASTANWENMARIDKEVVDGLNAEDFDWQNKEQLNYWKSWVSLFYYNDEENKDHWEELLGVIDRYMNWNDEQDGLTDVITQLSNFDANNGSPEPLLKQLDYLRGAYGNESGLMYDYTGLKQDAYKQVLAAYGTAISAAEEELKTAKQQIASFDMAHSSYAEAGSAQVKKARDELVAKEAAAQEHLDALKAERDSITGQYSDEYKTPEVEAAEERLSAGGVLGVARQNAYMPIVRERNKNAKGPEDIVTVEQLVAEDQAVVDAFYAGELGLPSKYFTGRDAFANWNKSVQSGIGASLVNAGYALSQMYSDFNASATNMIQDSNAYAVDLGLDHRVTQREKETYQAEAMKAEMYDALNGDGAYERDYGGTVLSQHDHTERIKEIDAQLATNEAEHDKIMATGGMGYDPGEFSRLLADNVEEKRRLTKEKKELEKDQYEYGVEERPFEKLLRETGDRLDAESQRLFTQALNSVGPGAQFAMKFGKTAAEVGFDTVVSLATHVPALVPMAVRVFGQETAAARRDGASFDQSILFGAAKTGIEVFTEKMFGMKGFTYGKGFLSGLADNMVADLGTSTWGMIVLSFLSHANEEGMEEVVSDLLAPLADMIYRDEDFETLFRQETANILESYFLGAILGLSGTITSFGTVLNDVADVYKQDAKAFSREGEAATGSRLNALVGEDVVDAALTPREQNQLSNAKRREAYQKTLQDKIIEAETGVKNRRGKGGNGTGSDANDVNLITRTEARTKDRIEQMLDRAGDVGVGVIEHRRGVSDTEAKQGLGPQEPGGAPISPATNAKEYAARVKADSTEVTTKIKQAVTDGKLTPDRVAEVSEADFSPKDSEKKLSQKVAEFFKSLGNKVKSTALGGREVIIDENSIQSDIAHGVGRAKACTFKAVPEVLEKGVVIDEQTNWKNRGYDTKIIAGAVSIDGKPAYVGCVVVGVQEGGTTRFYLHEVVDGNGELIYNFDNMPAAPVVKVTPRPKKGSGVAVKTGIAKGDTGTTPESGESVSQEGSGFKPETREEIEEQYRHGLTYEEYVDKLVANNYITKEDATKMLAEREAQGAKKPKPQQSEQEVAKSRLANLRKRMSDGDVLYVPSTYKKPIAEIYKEQLEQEKKSGRHSRDFQFEIYMDEDGRRLTLEEAAEAEANGEKIQRVRMITRHTLNEMEQATKEKPFILFKGSARGGPVTLFRFDGTNLMIVHGYRSVSFDVISGKATIGDLVIKDAKILPASKYQQAAVYLEQTGQMTDGDGVPLYEQINSFSYGKNPGRQARADAIITAANEWLDSRQNAPESTQGAEGTETSPEGQAAVKPEDSAVKPENNIAGTIKAPKRIGKAIGKRVAEIGRVVRALHGGTGTFSGSNGIWFTDSKQAASTFVGDKTNRPAPGSGEEGIYEVELDLGRTLVVDADGNMHDHLEAYDIFPGLKSTTELKTYFEEQLLWDTEDFFHGVMTTDELAQYAKDHGYDSVIIRNVIDEHYSEEGAKRYGKTDPQTDYIVFDSSRITPLSSQPQSGMIEERGKSSIHRDSETHELAIQYLESATVDAPLIFKTIEANGEESTITWDGETLYIKTRQGQEELIPGDIPRGYAQYVEAAILSGKIIEIPQIKNKEIEQNGISEGISQIGGNGTGGQDAGGASEVGVYVQSLTPPAFSGNKKDQRIKEGKWRNVIYDYAEKGARVLESEEDYPESLKKAVAWAINAGVEHVTILYADAFYDGNGGMSSFDPELGIFVVIQEGNKSTARTVIHETVHNLIARHYAHVNSRIVLEQAFTNVGVPKRHLDKAYAYVKRIYAPSYHDDIFGDAGSWWELSTKAQDARIHAAELENPDFAEAFNNEAAEELLCDLVSNCNDWFRYLDVPIDVSGVSENIRTQLELADVFEETSFDGIEQISESFEDEIDEWWDNNDPRLKHPLQPPVVNVQEKAAEAETNPGLEALQQENEDLRRQLEELKAQQAEQDQRAEQEETTQVQEEPHLDQSNIPGTKADHKTSFEDQMYDRGARIEHETRKQEIAEKFGTDDGTFFSKTREKVSRMARWCISHYGLQNEYDRLMNKRDWDRLDYSIAGKIIYEMNHKLHLDMSSSRGLGPVLEMRAGESFEEYNRRQAESDKEAYRARRQEIDVLMQLYNENKSKVAQELQEKYKFSVADEIRMRASQRFLGYTIDGEVGSAEFPTRINVRMWKVVDDLLNEVEAIESKVSEGYTPEDVQDLINTVKRINYIRGRHNLFGKLGVKGETMLFAKMVKNGVEPEALVKLAYGSVGRIMDDLITMSWADAAHTIRISNMLSNIATAVNNLANNAVSARTGALAQNIAVLPAKAFEKLTGKKVAFVDAGLFRTKPIRRAEALAFEYSLLSSYYGLMVDEGRLDTKGHTGGFDVNGSMVERLLARYNFFVSAAALNPDAPVKARVRAGMQAGIDKAFAGMTMENPENFQNKKELEGFAVQESKRRTLQDDNALTNFILYGKNQLNKIHTPGGKTVVGTRELGSLKLGDFLMAFAKVPTNVVQQKIAATPYGALYHVGRYAMGIAQAKADPNSMTSAQMAKLSRDVGRAATTAGMIVIGALAAARGALKNFDNGDDEEKKLAAEKGYRGLMFNVDALFRPGDDWQEGDHIISGGFLEVLAMPFAIGGLIWDDYVDNDRQHLMGSIWNGTTQSFTQILDSIGDIPGLQQAGELYQSFMYADPSGDDDAWMKTKKAIGLFAASSSTSYYMPNLFSQAAAGFSNTVKDVYRTDSYGQTLLYTMLNKIPGARKLIPEKTDAFGNVRRYGSNRATAMLNTVALPGDVHVYHQNEVEREFSRLRKAGYDGTWFDTSEPKSFTTDGQQFTLTADQSRTYHDTKAGHLMEAYQTFINSDEYKNLSDAERVAVFSDLRLDADRQTKKETLEVIDPSASVKMDSWETTLTTMEDRIQYLSAKAQLSTVWDDEDGVTDYAAMDNLIKTVYPKLSKDQRKLLDGSIPYADQMYDASKSGIDSKSWQIMHDIYSEYNETDEDGKKIHSADLASESEMWEKMAKKTGYSDNGKEIKWARDKLELHYIGTPNSENYDALIDKHGWSLDSAHKLMADLDALVPTKGRKNVSPKQRYTVVAKQNVPDSQKYKAFFELVPSNYTNIIAKMKRYQRQGIDYASALKAAKQWDN